MIQRLNQSRPISGGRAKVAAMMLAAAASLIGAEGHVSAASQSFAGLSGSWSGAGTISLGNGSRERIRCRATYVAGRAGNTLQQSLRCASDSYHFDLHSNVRTDGTSLFGSWTETTRNLNGSVTGTVRGNQIEALVDTAGFSATITIYTRGNRQSVTLRSLNRDFSGATITLRRG
jgi:hypothetical protein